MEILIVMSLMIVLLSMIWSLLQVYSSYYTSGTKRMERSQIVRSLAQLLNDDLGAAIQDPIHPLAPSLVADDAVRRFGLLGTADTLRVDVLQINPLDPTVDVSSVRRAAVGLVQNMKMQVPELKTIFYDYRPLTSNSAGNQGGLVRREISFEMPDVYDTSGQNPETEIENEMSLLSGLIPTPQPTQPKTIAERLQQENDPNAMWAPEVVDFRFRYGDGTNWLDSWNSIEKNGLPVAVEMTMKLMSVGDVEKLQRNSSRLPKTEEKTQAAESLSPDSIRSVGGALRSGEMGQTDMTGTELEVLTIPPLGDFSQEEMASTEKTLEQLAEELGLAPPIKQRVVVYLATSPLVKSQPIRRPAVPAVPKPQAMTPPPPPAQIVAAPVTPPESSPQPTLPSQQWLRK